MTLLRNAACLALLCAPLLAFAEGGPCRAEVEKYCAQAQGGKQITDCLLDHQQNVSDACYGALKKRLEAEDAMKACGPDAKKLCQGVQPGGGRIVNCLLDHQKELSDACYDTLAKKTKGKS